jgi:acyl dehydratase
MPLPVSVVGASTEPVTHTIDERWTMAYAAGIGDHNPAYLDTRRAGGVVAHPLFPVCIEWPVVLDARRLVPPEILPRDEAVRGVHATHDLQIERLIRPGDVLTTTATVESVEQRRPGAYEVLRLTTTDASGATVCTTRMGSLFLGVDVDDDGTGDGGSAGRAVHQEAMPIVEPVGGWDGVDPTGHVWRDIGVGAAHIYTECSRIWNPIHTDPAVAEVAGLPGIILHGTATLAMAVSAIVESCAGGDPARVRRISGRFGAMVLMPSPIDIRFWEPPNTAEPSSGARRHFEVLDASGNQVIKAGVVELMPPTDAASASS